MGGWRRILRVIAKAVPDALVNETDCVHELEEQVKNLNDVVHMHALEIGHTKTRQINITNRITSDLARGKNVDDLVDAAVELGILKQVGSNKHVGEPIDEIQAQMENEKECKVPFRTYSALTYEQCAVYKKVMNDLKQAGYQVPDQLGRDVLPTEKKPRTMVVKEIKAPTAEAYAHHEGARHCLVDFSADLGYFLHTHNHTLLVWMHGRKVDQSAEYARLVLTRNGRKVKERATAQHALRAVTPYVDRSFSNAFIVGKYSSVDEAARMWQQHPQQMKRDVMPHDFETLIFRTTHGHNIGDILYKIPAQLTLQEEIMIVDCYAQRFGLAVDKALWEDLLDRGIRLSCSHYGEPNENPFLRERVARHIKHVTGACVEPTPQAIFSTYNNGIRSSLFS